MFETRTLRRGLLHSLVGALVAGAVTGIAVFILGDFGELEMKILITTLSLTFFSVTSLCCTAVLERRRGGLLAVPGLVASVVGLGWSLAVIWPEWDSELMVKTLVILIILAFSFGQSCMLALPRLKAQLAWMFPVSLACIFSLAALLSLMIIFEWDDELLFRLAGVLGILDAGMTLAIPLVFKLTGKAPPEQVPLEGAAETGGLTIELSCPRCGRQGVYPLGAIECPECSLRIRVEVDEQSSVEKSPPRRGGRFQFSLRAILVAFLIVSLPLGWIGYRLDQLRRQAAVIEALAPLNPQVYYRYGNARGITISDPAKFDASLLEWLKELPDLESLSLSGVPITEDDVARLDGLSARGVYVYIESTRLTPESVEELKKTHPGWNISTTNTPPDVGEPATEPAASQ